MTRRELLQLPLFLQARRRKLNVVFILADDLGGADLGCYGADLHETPNLDALARESVRFTNAYSAAPICSPTRASIMTGKHPARLHMTIWLEGAKRKVTNRAMIPPATVWNLPHSEVTLGEVFHEAGYLTAAIGKWHLGEATHYPETQGFDINIGGTLWGAPQTYFAPYRGNKHFGGEERYVPHMEGWKQGEYLTDRLASEALRVAETAGAKPFFLYLAHHNPHTPIEGKPALVEHYQRKLKAGMNHQNAHYAAMVHTLDENVGRIVQGLKRSGKLDNTLLVFTSDNGGFIGRYDGQQVTNNTPLRSGKGSLYEGGVRVPLMIRVPGAKAGVCDEPVYSCDLNPTVAELAGATAAPQPDGLSLAPLIQDPRARLNRDALFFHYPHYYDTTTPVSAVRQRDWKLLEYHEDGRLELYNLAQDPTESKNLAAANTGMRDQLAARLRDWRKQVDAQMPEPNPAFRR